MYSQQHSELRCSQQEVGLIFHFYNNVRTVVVKTGSKILKNPLETGDVEQITDLYTIRASQYNKEMNKSMLLAGSTGLNNVKVK